MVATSLPFWLHHPSRTMSNFSAETAWGAGASARPTEVGRPRPLGDDLVVERVDVEVMAAHEAAWRDLVGRALEPNVFLEPGFALPAARLFAPARRPSFVLIWASGNAGTTDLIGLCPVQRTHGGFSAPFVTVWTHDQATTSIPLLDRERGAEALEALLAWAVGAQVGSCGLLLGSVAAEGPLARLLADRARCRCATVEQRTRAVLPHAEVSGEPAPQGLASKRAKEMRRQHRRLSEDGRLEFRSARSVEDVRAAAEHFLDLEARGWKGVRGTALLLDPALAAFTRTMTRLLARDGKCRIDSLVLDDRPVAMGIVLQSGNRAYFWKTAYDEAQGTRSPGKQLAVMLTAAQLDDRRIELTDSCAAPDHPMIDRIWPARMAVADILVAPSGKAPPLFARAVRDLVLRRRCRQAAKIGLLAIRRFFTRFAARHP